MFDFLSDQSLWLPHRRCSQSIQTSGWQPEVQTNTGPLTKVKYQIRRWRFTPADVHGHVCRGTASTHMKEMSWTTAVNWSVCGLTEATDILINTIVVVESVEYFHSLIPAEHTVYFHLSKQTLAVVAAPVSSSLLEMIKEQNSLFPVDISRAGSPLPLY